MSDFSSLSSTHTIAVEPDHVSAPLGPGESSRLWRLPGISDLELLHGSYRSFSFTRHFHPVAAIGVVESGAMRTFCQGRMHVAPDRTVILFNPGEVHAPEPASRQGWSFRMFYLHGELLHKISEALGHSAPLWFEKPFVEDRNLSESLLRLHRSLEDAQSTLQAESLLVTCFARVADSLFPGKSRGIGTACAHVERVRQYLSANCHENLRLDQLAGIAGLSPYHFLRSFQKYVGLTPHAFLMQARVEKGRLLLQSGLPISHVALQMGFVDQAHFTRHFKKFTGVTPGKYFPQGPHSQRAGYRQERQPPMRG